MCREESEVVFRTQEGDLLPAVADVIAIDLDAGHNHDLDPVLDASAEDIVHPRMLTPVLDHRRPDYRYISSILLQ